MWCKRLMSAKPRTRRGYRGASAVERFEKCRAAGDRAGMALGRSVGIYSVVSAMHGTGRFGLFLDIRLNALFHNGPA
jgi:hypothetical protein